MDFDNTQLKIDLDAVADNFRAVCEKAHTAVMAIIKADAYGHGAVTIAKLLESQCAFFGVSSMLEALELRNAGITRPILILGPVSRAAYESAIEQDIRLCIFRYDDAEVLSREAQRLGKSAVIHFAVDTGMSRIGFQVAEDSANDCARIARLPGLVCEGLFSHFATADSANLSRTEAQARRFADFDAMLRARGVVIPIRHLDNSAGIMNYPHSYEMVRSGIITYGLYPSDEVDPALLNLRPALSWVSHISHVKALPAGREISYGGTFTTTRPTRVATVPVGYADGYRRNLSGKFHVLICGRKAPILGRVCMDQLMVDVTDIPEAKLGSLVTLIGCDGDAHISVEEIAAAADSFNYEFVCGISRRVPRVYLQGGSVVSTVRYLL